MINSPIEDRELVLKMQSGDLEALGELYDRHRCMVYRTALAITGDPELANDLLQDVFLRLNRFADRIDPQRPLEPWLYRMTANLAYTAMKRWQRSLRLLEEKFDWFLIGSSKNSPQELTEEQDEWRRVETALFDLPLAQRVVVVLFYLNEFSLQEIAETLKIPLGTVKSRLHYGRRSLQYCLQDRPLAENRPVPDGTSCSALSYEGQYAS
ncbi:MAG: RNA polymerase sigma factor [Chloroflexota bacterium]